jgi:hypothetical protein
MLRIAALALLLLIAHPAAPYSVQTHEQLIDLTWKSSIEPLLLHRFPNMTPAQLREAHAYAYGGCAIQDIGYYPFGNKFFSDLTHYVRSGDFVQSLLRNSQTPDDFAFAIGALTHYIGDSIGHSQAVNPSVALEFPKLAARYGPIVTYEESEHAHVQTEFAFDINEISKRRFAPSAYLRHVGINIPQALLAKAFFETYGLDITRVLGKHHPTLRSYRFSVRSFLPRIAYAETILHRSGFPADTPGQPLDNLKAQLAQSDFENGWDQYRRKAGIGTYSLAGLIFILPKVGPLSLLAIRGPNQDTEEKYVESLNQVTATLRQLISQPNTIAAAIPNRDLDTGAKVIPGAYRLTDQTYSQLLQTLTANPQRGIPAGLKRDVLAYYADPTAPIYTKKNPEQWAKVQSELKTLANQSEKTEPPAFTEPD